MAEPPRGPLRRARIGLGSNEDAARNLARARGALAAELCVVACSAEREFASSDGGADRYRNQIIDVETDLSRVALEALLKRLETHLGRTRAPSARVTIDLDLLSLEGEYEAAELSTAAHWRALDGEAGA